MAFLDYLKTKKNISKDDWINSFFAKTEHEWIKSNKYVYANFLDFFDLLPVKLIEQMITKFPIVFVSSNGKFSCSVTDHHTNVIIIFPEVMQLLQSMGISSFKGILSHEIGHIFLEHGKRNMGTLESQVEADKFAASLGFLEDLENFLLDQPESIEKRVRLSYLSSMYFA